MVGIDKIREYLGDFNANYVIIGGTARNLHLEEAGLQGRVTKDIDMIIALIVKVKEIRESMNL
jgi:predicted nucleotidyltransferase